MKNQIIAHALLVAGLLASGASSRAAPAMSVEEKLAESVWKLRAALNVAALQCQFDKALRTVDNYNDVNKMHKTEIDGSRATMESRYRRLYGKGGLGAFDRYNTKLWNGFSSVTHQVPFCNKASEVGKELLVARPGTIAVIANNRVPEILAIFPALAKPVIAAKPGTQKSTKKRSGKKRRK